MPPTPKKKPKQNKPVIVAVCSDLHAGSTVGLCPPTFQLDDGGTYKATSAQRWLWRSWKQYIGKVQDTAKQHGTGYQVIINGDAIEGNHHHTTQVISSNETTQMNIADAVLLPLLQDAGRAYFIRGTPVHVGSAARMEERIAGNYDHVVPDKETGAATHYQLDININGTRFDIAHHGPIGRLDWTKTNALGKVAIEAELRGWRTFGKPPHLLIRSHNHQYMNSHDNYPVQVIGTPAWQLVTGYVQRLKPGALADIGGLIFTCWPGGRYDLEVVRFKPKPTAPERIVS